MAKYKRGLSPVIATSLLVAITIVLALIFYMWARGITGEVLQKQGEPIENSCNLIDFDADISGNTISVVNRANIPLYGVEIKKVGLGSVESKSVLQRTLASGEDATITITETFAAGDEAQVIPVIIGEAGNGKRQYSCTSNSKTITAL